MSVLANAVQLAQNYYIQNYPIYSASHNVKLA